MYARMALGAAVVLAVSAGAWKLYHAGGAKVRTDWNAEKLVQSESSRLAEKARGLANQRIDNAFQIDKARRAAADRVTANKLREFQAAGVTNADTTAPSGVDNPYRDIASRCTEALVRLDSYASSVAGTAKGLQGYVLNVCRAQ